MLNPGAGPGLAVPAQPALPSVRAAGDAEVWPAGRGWRGTSREDGPSVQGRGRILSSVRSAQAAALATATTASASRAAEGAPVRGSMQHMTGIRVAGPEPAALPEASAERLALLRQLTSFLSLLGNWRRGGGVLRCRWLGEGLLMKFSKETFPPEHEGLRAHSRTLRGPGVGREWESRVAPGRGKLICSASCSARRTVRPRAGRAER